MFLKCRISLIALMLAAMAGCGKKGIPAPKGGSEIPPSKVNLRRSVEVARVEQKSLVSYVETVGLIEAENTTDIAAGVAGLVDEVLFREGDILDPKDQKPLIKIDQRRYRAALQVAEAAEREAIANLNAAKDANQRAINGGGAVAAEVRIQTAELMAVAAAKLNSAQASLDVAKLNYSRSEVHVPFSGQVNTRKVAVGEYVDEKTIIATMADLSKVRITAFVPESAAPLVRRWIERRPTVSAMRQLGSSLTATSPWLQLFPRVGIATGEIPAGYDPEFSLQSLPDRRFGASIFFMSKVADPTTHMFECKSEVDPRTVGLQDLAPGNTARIRFPVETHSKALILPEEAVRATERGFIVFEPMARQGKDGAAEWVAKARRVELGMRSPGQVEVRQGIQPGAWIIKRGADSLEDGTPIKFPAEQEKSILAENRNP